MAVASGLFRGYKTLRGEGAINTETADIRAVLIKESVDAPDLDLNEFLSDVSSTARSVVATVPGRTVAAQADRWVHFSHGAMTFASVPALPSNGTYDGVLYYVHNASENAAILVGYFRSSLFLTSGGQQLNQVPPNGGDITITPNPYLWRE